ncbi:MAG: hypothetical protein QM750_19105 [Rubrivivax sp.]
MPHRPRLATAALGLAGALLAACCLAATPQAEAVQHGPFEIVASGRRISTGTFPNIGGNPFATQEVTSFLLRWRGRPVQVPGRGDRFWQVLRLPDAPQPALLLVQQDFTLVTEQDGQLRAQPLSSASNSLAEAQWLDSDAGQPGEPQSWGIAKVDAATQTVMRGGRFLRLGSRLVLDVHRLVLHTVEPGVPMRPGVPVTSLARDGDRARAFSPGRTQYVLAGSQYDYERGRGQVHGLLVVDLPSGSAYELRVDRRRMPFADTESIDGAWIRHYFAWQQDAAGRERLQPRAGVRPLPWRGRIVDTTEGRLEYRVPRMRRAFAAELRRVVLQQPGAELAPDWVDPRRGIDGNTLRVDGCLLAISATSALPDERSAEDLDDEGAHVSLYAPSTAGKPAAACGGLIRRIGQAMDAELASGQHDRHVVLD